MSTTRMAALQSQIEARQAEIDALAEADDITTEQDAQLDALLGEQRAALAEVATIEARAAALAEVRAAAADAATPRWGTHSGTPFWRPFADSTV